MKKYVIVTGGAGYIGSHTCKQLKDEGFIPVVLDNLSRGHIESAGFGPFHKISLSEVDSVRKIISFYSPVAVIHFAGYAYVQESMKQPLMYYENNVVNSLNLLSVIVPLSIPIIFSSSCATYGITDASSILETHEQKPINPYGNTKLTIEKILQDLSTYRNFRYVALRYFNAAGDNPDMLGELHFPETHIIPLIVLASLEKHKLSIYGDSVRDFTHVDDIAKAHILALKYLLDNGKSEEFNVGTNVGTSLLELIDIVKDISKTNFSFSFEENRKGDPLKLVANSDKIRKILNWSPTHDIYSIVSSAFKWHSSSTYMSFLK